MTKTKFLGWATEELLKEGIAVRLVQKRSVQGCAGWFDASEKEFMVCVKHPDFYSVFVHEFCHFLQWRDNREWWDKHMTQYENFLSWVHKTSKVKTGRRECQIVELDCDRRAVALIKEKKLNIDLDQYIKKANSHIFFYLVVEKKRKWPRTGSGIYEPEVLACYPARFLKFSKYQRISNIPPDVLKLLTSYD